jgi:hypothetical protein
MSVVHPYFRLVCTQDKGEGWPICRCCLLFRFAWAFAGVKAEAIRSTADLRALGLATALSMRTTHPVSRAVATLGRDLGPRLPHPDILDFRLVAGARTCLIPVKLLTW